MIVVLPVKSGLGSSLDWTVLVGFGLLVRFGMSPCVLVKVVRQLLFSRLLGNHRSQDCKAIIYVWSMARL
jgi:hypothetical protein